MGALCFILFMLVALALALAIPTALIVIFYRWLKRKGYERLAQIITFVIVVCVSFMVYTAVYPLESFYKDDFKHETNLTLPASCKFLSKDATYPDIHGKYISDALVEFSNVDYDSLLTKVSFDTTFIPDTSYIERRYSCQLLKNIPFRKVIKSFEKCRMTIVFLDDNKTVAIERGLYKIEGYPVTSYVSSTQTGPTGAKSDTVHRVSTNKVTKP